MAGWRISAPTTSNSGSGCRTGVRIAPRDGDASLLALTPVAGPAATDEVVESGGVRLFLEFSTAAVLRDKVLDARMDDRGSAGFLISAPACEKHRG